MCDRPCDHMTEHVCVCVRVCVRVHACVYRDAATPLMSPCCRQLPTKSGGLYAFRLYVASPSQGVWLISVVVPSAFLYLCICEHESPRSQQRGDGPRETGT